MSTVVVDTGESSTVTVGGGGGGGGGGSGKDCPLVQVPNDNVQLKIHRAANDAVLDNFKGGGGMSSCSLPSPLLPPCTPCTPALWMVSIPDTLLSLFTPLTTLSSTI